MDYKYRRVGFISLKEYRSLMAYKKGTTLKSTIYCVGYFFIVYIKKNIRIKPNILRLKIDHEFWDLFVSVLSTRLEKTRFL